MERTGDVAYNTKYENDATIPEGQQVTKQAGSNGGRAVSYRLVYDKDGNIVSQNQSPVLEGLGKIVCDDIIYKDSMVYIPEKDETEPARILTTIFKDDGEKVFELTVATPSIEK